MTNPLLDFAALPRFTEILPEHVSPAVDSVLAEARTVLARVIDVATPARWEAVMVPLSDSTEKISWVWDVVSHLNAVVNTPALRDAYNENLAKLTEFYTELGQNLALFQQVKAIAASADYAQLTPAQQRIVANDVRDFRLSGADLPEAEKARFADIQARLSELSARFAQNVLDATDDFARYVDDAAELAGLPDDTLAMMQAAAEADGKTGYKLKLHLPFYLPVMQYADHRPLRESLYHAYATRAAEFGKPDWDNTALIGDTLSLREEEAQLLGFANAAEVSLAAKMADSPAQVMDFLTDMATRAKPFALRDRAELEAFARDTLGLNTLEAWDLAYVSEKLRVARYAFSEQEVKRYFPEPKVLAGLFGLIEILFGVTIAEVALPVWHVDARYYEVRRDGQAVAAFYTDLYAREGKRGGAWMADVRGRKRLADGTIQLPVALLTCNFTAPVGDSPALFTHDEVITLFHECGHGLHHMLTEVDELGVSGINGVEWDAVELPSQFLENFCWEWDVLQGMTAHADSGEPLPRALYDKMLAARHFQSGMQTVRQMELSLFDMKLHAGFAEGGDFMALLAEVRRDVAVNLPPAYNRLPHSFTHIFAGGYAAGYYSYKWAEVLSADAYAAFEETGGANPATGAAFQREVLAVGGSRPAMDSFRAFRGREPEIDALLRHTGMVG
jgi:oligopeptidase A